LNVATLDLTFNLGC